jgi:hypothetical protein
LPGFKVGKHWRFRRDTIINWIKAKEGNSLTMVMPVTPSGKE